MARVESVSASKRTKQGVRFRRGKPHEGTVLRLWFDEIKASEGRPFSASIPSRVKDDLMDFYALDIVVIEKSHNIRGPKRVAPSSYVLAGEWFGSKYVDYVARQLNQVAQ
jgi:hypothetical protein